MKVLIIDDNQDITDLLSRFLKAKGVENISTNDPFAGLDLIKNTTNPENNNIFCNFPYF